MFFFHYDLYYRLHSIIVNRNQQFEFENPSYVRGVDCRVLGGRRVAVGAGGGVRSARSGTSSTTLISVSCRVIKI